MEAKKPIYTRIYNINRGELVVSKDIEEAVSLYRSVYPLENIESVEQVKANNLDSFGLAICGTEE